MAYVKPSSVGNMLLGLFMLIGLMIKCGDGFLGFPRRSTVAALSLPRRHPFLCPRQKSSCSLSVLPSQLVHDLDLVPLMEQVAAYTVTLRGRRALLGLVQKQAKPTVPLLASSTTVALARQRRAQGDGSFRKSFLQLELAENANQAVQAYELVEQARLVLQPPDKDMLPPLPFYGPNDPWDTSTRDDTDDDEWLDLPVSEWTLQDILKAEKITERLLQLYAWSQNGNSTLWTPDLALMARQITFTALQPALQHIAQAVEINRVKTATDPTGRSSYRFALSKERFPILGVLRDKLEDLQARVNKQPNLQSQLEDFKQELDEKEEFIRLGLCQAIAAVRKDIDQGLSIMAEIDVVLAKAAFGVVHHGAIPRIPNKGVVNVTGFVHPLLVDEGPNKAVPIDLRLAEAFDEQISPPPALIISGPNGGGKTLAMKSFGLVCQMVKLGIPIPVASTGPSTAPASRPLVGFFDDVISALGDRQSVATGQSTFMAQLSSYADILDNLNQTASTAANSSILVLLDELGSGTEAEGGGAIGQAVLEHMLESLACRVVATTHSSRLKATSFQDDRFACATVLLEESHGVRQPSYRLEYGLIGESFALVAASRSKPPLPESVLRRAAELCRPDDNTTESTVDRSYLQALTASLEQEKALSRSARQEAQQYVEEMATCRAAMIQLARQYDRQLGFWENRVTECFEKLRNDQTDSLELLGASLGEIRVAQKRIQSSAERLKERGLRLVPANYQLSKGEFVVICGGEWEGAEGSIVEETLGPNQVSVSLGPLQPGQTITLGRHEIAIWDYDSVFEKEDWQEANDWESSREDSKRRLNGILSSLGSSARPGPKSVATTQSYTSSRGRKIAKKRRKK